MLVLLLRTWFKPEKWIEDGIKTWKSNITKLFLSNCMTGQAVRRRRTFQTKRTIRMRNVWMLSHRFPNNDQLMSPQHLFTNLSQHHHLLRLIVLCTLLYQFTISSSNSNNIEQTCPIIHTSKIINITIPVGTEIGHWDISLHCLKHYHRSSKSSSM